ncbi:fatty acid hydroxylase domain containing protein [Rhypophila sp. PSN 637]
MPNIDAFLARYPAGYIEILGSVSVQLLYFVFGLLIEKFLRPSYKSSTTPRMIVQSLQNHLVATSLHILYVFLLGGGSVLTKTFTPPYQTPTWTELITHLTIGIILRDIIFWTIHRLWHSSAWVYNLVHAKHHEVLHPGEHHVWTISYMGVVDFVFLYGMPVVLVAKVLEMNLLTTLVFAFVSAAGEQVKLVWGDEAHDEHHLDGGVCFGAYGVMDWICGTGGKGIEGDVKRN